MSTQVSELNKKTAFELLDIQDFNERIVGAYNDGTAEEGLPADESVARSLIPAGTGALRDFSYIAPDIPEFTAENCVACMECVTQCPDTAILGKAIPESKLSETIDKLESGKLKGGFRTNGRIRINSRRYRQNKEKNRPNLAFLLTLSNVKAVLNAWMPVVTMTHWA